MKKIMKKEKKKILKNKSNESILVRIDGIKKEIKAGESFETNKADELLRLYKNKFEIADKVEKVEKVEEKKEESKVKKTTKKSK